VEGRDKNGKFMEGNKIATGRPKDSAAEDFRVALAKVHSKKKITILEHFIEQAYKDNKVLVAVAKKLIADKTHIEGDIKGDVTVNIIDSYKEEDGKG